MKVKVSKTGLGLSYTVEREGRNDAIIQINEVSVCESEIELYRHVDGYNPSIIRSLPLDEYGLRSIYTVILREAPGPDSIADHVCVSWNEAVVRVHEILEFM